MLGSSVQSITRWTGPATATGRTASGSSHTTCQNPQSSTRVATGQPHLAQARLGPYWPSQPQQQPPNRSGMKTVPRTSPGAIPILSGGPVMWYVSCRTP
ncbi:hypothetical protein [Nonomuraea sp. NPDC001023]|uniref:hypothetical protein n=1 Tax=unclassified Nonomuraea TaxID=2593643 RepID=UPI0033209AE2